MTTTLRLVGGRDALPPATDPTDLFPSPLSPELLGECLRSVSLEVLADALATLRPESFARVVDMALMRRLIELEAGAHLEHAVLTARALGQLCDELGTLARARSSAR